MIKILKEAKDKKFRKIKLGSLGKQILVLLLNGVILWLTRGPKRQSYILQNIPKELKRTKEVYLNRAIKRLYQSKLIDYKENEDGTISIIISEEGKKKILMYKIENLKLKRQDKWDGYWRIIIFDIPEELQYIRRIFCRKLKEIGMYQLQKSVYIYPFKCKDELDFIIEYFNLRPYVRFGLLKEIDNELHLRKIFDLI
jgi:DNA-binding transcriptional regulator PaaX